MTLKKTHIRVGGMSCSACTSAVTNALNEIEGVQSAEVSLMTEDALVTHEDKVESSTLKDAIEDVGFEATLLETDTVGDEKTIINTQKQFVTHLTIEGMSCSACVSAVTGSLMSLPGVESADVSLMTQEATVHHSGDVTTKQLTDAVEDTGFGATLKDSAESVVEGSSSQEDNSSRSSSSLEKITIKVLGMTCGSCSSTVESQVSQLPGIVNCTVALSTEEARITYDSDLVGIRTIIETIDDCGFDAVLTNSMDTMTQMTLLAKVKDVTYWRTNFFKLLVVGLPLIFMETIWPEITKLCRWSPDSFKIVHGVYWDILIQLILGTYVQFWLGKHFYINTYKALKHGAGTMDTLICTSTTIIYFYSVATILRGIIFDVQGPPSVLFGTSAMLLSFVSLGKWAENKAKGNTSTALSKLLSLAPAKCIIVENPEVFDQDLSKDKSGALLGNISQKEILSQLIQKGDIAVILPGSSVPADGVCIFGRSDTNESLLTGESLPVSKKPGSKLVCGTINISSTMYMRVERVGEKTQLQQIVKLVKDAQMSKAPVQRLADAIAAKFVPTILTLALITFISWSLYIQFNDSKEIPSSFKDPKTGKVLFSQVMKLAISVIVVACPCALGLAAPTAVMVGTGAGATNGILIKGGEVLEKASTIDTIVFDKTGTITSGKMKLSDHHFYGSFKQKECRLLSLIYALEQNSEHPMARAVCKGISKLMDQPDSEINPASISITQIETIGGLGISAVASIAGVESKPVMMGSANYIRGVKKINEDDFQDALKVTAATSIGSISHIMIGNEYCGYFELKDTIHTDSKATINALIDSGYSVAMVTGDNARTARFVCSKVGIPITNILAEARPAQKLEYVKLLQDKGHHVAFVGDGINDAPALVQADTGIAVASGTDVAMSSADIVLLSSDMDVNDIEAESETQRTAYEGSSMQSVFNAFEISKKTFKAIRLNFLLAVIYNFVMLPLAMGLLLIPFHLHMHPMAASAAMACSSVSVVGNSLRLKRWRPSNLEKYRNSYNPPIEDLPRDEESSIEGIRDVTKITVDDFNSNDRRKPKLGWFAKVKAKVNFKRRRGFGESYELLPTARTNI